MTTISGYVHDTGPAPAYEPQLDYSFLNIIPVIPRVNAPQALPTTWPPPGFFNNNPQAQGQFMPAFNPLSPQPLKNDAQLDYERQQIQQAQVMPSMAGASSLLWLAAIGAAAYYFYKKGKA